MASHNNKRDEQGMNQFSTTVNVGRRLVAWITACALLFSTTAPYAAQSITYYHWDAVGSPVAATDEDGNVKWREQYRPYGERIENQAAAQSNSRWYTGHPHDNATGLTYAGARYYDPVVGRFMGVDPQPWQEDEPNLFNRFAYGNNNPYKYVDPDGELPVLVIGVALYAGYKLLTYSNHANAPALGEAHQTLSIADHAGVVADAMPAGKMLSTGKAVWHAVDSKGPNVSEGKAIKVERVTGGGLSPVGRPMSPEQARRAVDQGHDVYTKDRVTAKEIAGRRATRSEIHPKKGEPRFPHYHRPDRKGGHIFHGKGE